jgi:hypothetical protein
MTRRLGLMLWTVIAGCTGPQGPIGLTGENGLPGMVTPSVSAVTPPYAFLSRTVDLTIAGSGTTWSSGTTVAFANPQVKVNKVTVASVTGLLVNVTVAVGPTDVTVTDGGTSVVYAGAFTVLAPLVVTVDPPAGVLQGGLADLHVAMLDLTTPFDPDTTTVTLSSPDLTATQPQPSDYALDLTVEADVLAATGIFDLTVSSGETGAVVTSQASKSYAIVARAPTTLTPTTAGTGTIATALDTALYELTPASPAQQFVQFTTSSQVGALSGTVLPASGKYADAIVTDFAIRYGQGTTSTDPFYVIVGDSDGLAGPGPTPADLTLVAFESACTAMTGITGSSNGTPATAQAVSTLPALVSGTLATMADVDVYSFTVTGAPATIHVATGGDPLDDTVLTISDPTQTVVATSNDEDYQEDLFYTAETDGTYYVSVAASTSGAFQLSDNTYQLFIAVK